MRIGLLAAAGFFALCSTAYAGGIGIKLGSDWSRQRTTLGEQAAHVALGYRGVPYVWGGDGPAGFDCSGFTRFVYGQVGISLAHSSFAQWETGHQITARSQLRPGDLVFFAGLSHVGLYLGHNRFIHAPHTGTEVSIASLTDGWYATTYAGAIRIAGSQRPYHPARRSPEHHRSASVPRPVEHPADHTHNPAPRRELPGARR